MRGLRTLFGATIRESSLWESSPVDCPPGSPMFVNAAVMIEPTSDETPESMLTKLQAIEREFGRLPKAVLNEPRPLDLDLIAFGFEENCFWKATDRKSTRLNSSHSQISYAVFCLKKKKNKKHTNN